jgi:hemerythrin
MLNSACKIISTCTLPWVQHRDAAFRDVEKKLMQLIQPPAPQNPMNAPLGQQMRVVKLTSADGIKLNGLLGEVVGSTENGRVLVNLGNCQKALRPENLEDATDAPVGKSVQVNGLTSEKGKRLNGQVGEVLGGTVQGRWIVKLNDATMALRKENLAEIADDRSDEKSLLSTVGSVGHSGMDEQHDSCINALTELVEKLSVKVLQRVRHELVLHFEDEEKLLRVAGFGGAKGGYSTSEDDNDFSAFGSHVKDHKRIIALADEALSMLHNVCDASDAHGGTVPKKVATDLCKAFAEHAKMYDSLYEGKLEGCEGADTDVKKMDQVD